MAPVREEANRPNVTGMRFKATHDLPRIELLEDEGARAVTSGEPLPVGRNIDAFHRARVADKAADLGAFFQVP